MLKECKLDAGEGGVLVTELSSASLQNCTIDGSRNRSTGIVVSCGGQVKAMDVKTAGITGVGVLVNGAESNAELYGCELNMSENMEHCSATDTLPMKVTCKGSVVLTNCSIQGGMGGIQVCPT